METCFFPVPWTDILEIILSDKFVFTTSGNDIPGDPGENLCVKAYNLLKNDFDIGPVNIHLHKIIPSGAGLGGGSSDAAHTLKMLNSIFSLNISVPRLMEYAAEIGSDCAFFIQDNAMIGTGRGEVLKRINLSLNKFLVIVKPPIHVSTRDAFSGITPRAAAVSVEGVLSTLPLKEWKHQLINAFEETVFRKYPLLGEIKNRLYAHGATYASMTGSGSALYGIFETEKDLAKEFSEAVYWAGFTSKG